MKDRKQSQRKRKKKSATLTRQDELEHAVFLSVVSAGESITELKQMRLRFAKTFN